MGNTLSLARFERLYDEQARFVAAVLIRLGVPPSSVSDAVQDVFITAYRLWSRYDAARPPRPWLAAIARRVAFRVRRSADRQVRKTEAFRRTFPDSAPPCEASVEARHILRTFIDELDEETRDVFVLAELEGYTALEIATRTGLAPNAVYQRVRRARQRLRDAAAVDAESSTTSLPAFAVLFTRLGTPASLGGTISSWMASSGFAIGLTAAVGVSGMTLGLVQHASGESTAVSSPTRTLSPETSRRVLAPEPPTALGSSVETELPVTPPQPPPAADADTLAQETTLIRKAQSYLAEGQAAKALSVLDRHSTRFPSGQLADARDRGRVRALCDLGQRDEARALASAWIERQPHNTFARQAASLCTQPTLD